MTAKDLLSSGSVGGWKALWYCPRHVLKATEPRRDGLLRIWVICGRKCPGGSACAGSLWRCRPPLGPVRAQGRSFPDGSLFVGVVGGLCCTYPRSSLRVRVSVGHSSPGILYNLVSAGGRGGSTGSSLFAGVHCSPGSSWFVTVRGGSTGSSLFVRVHYSPGSSSFVEVHYSPGSSSFLGVHCSPGSLVFPAD